MDDVKKLEKKTKYPVYFLDENTSFSPDHINFLKEQIIESKVQRIRLLLNPNFHDARQESIFIATQGAKFAEKRFPFLPWMECQLMEGDISLVQKYSEQEDFTFLNSQSKNVRFDPAVYHYFKITSSLAVFKIKSVGPYLEKLVQKKMG